MKTIVIHWGEEFSSHRDNPPKVYKFETSRELEAFLYGVSEAVGWSDWHEISNITGRCELCDCDQDGRWEDDSGAATPEGMGLC